MGMSDSELQTHSYRYIFHRLSLRHRCTQTETLRDSGQTSAVPCQVLKTSRQDGRLICQYNTVSSHTLKDHCAGNR